MQLVPWPRPEIYVRCLRCGMMGTVARSHSPSSEALNLFIVQQSLLGDDMPSTGASGAYLMAYEKLRKPVSRSEQWVGVVTALSTVAIILSDLTYLGGSCEVATPRHAETYTEPEAFCSWASPWISTRTGQDGLYWKVFVP